MSKNTGVQPIRTGAGYDWTPVAMANKAMQVEQVKLGTNKRKFGKQIDLLYSTSQRHTKHIWIFFRVR